MGAHTMRVGKNIGGKEGWEGRPKKDRQRRNERRGEFEERIEEECKEKRNVETRGREMGTKTVWHCRYRQ